MAFDFGALRRHPDVEGPGLEASDAADRLILDEAAPFVDGAAAGELVVLDDAYGALALASAAARGSGIRVHQDLITGERALADYAQAWAWSTPVVARTLWFAIRCGNRSATRQ